MKKKFQFSLAATILLCYCVSAFATWSITSPQANENFYPTSNIATAGYAEANKDIVVKLIDESQTPPITGGTYLKSTTTETDWSKDFPAPPVGWEASTKWYVKLYLKETNNGNETLTEEAVRQYVVVGVE